ncbi:glycosyltransferase family 39 protein [Ancylobacter defluvii]|nr:glycosyltransferase family 39 protein [Ancylobacter defluvii]
MAASRPTPATLAGRLGALVVHAWQSQTLTRLCSIVLFAGLTAWVLVVFRDYGISNDEPVQHTYGQLLWQWYGSGFKDDRAFHYINLYLYGGLFDLIAAGLEPYISLPVYDLRHLISACFGLAGLVAVWRWTRLLAGEKTAILAVAMLAVTGMYGGAMFTHTKDVPFAATMAWSLYFITCVAAALPGLPSWRMVAGLGFAVGCALGLRVGGVFAVFYLGLTIAVAGAIHRDLRLILRLVMRLIPAGLIAAAVTALAWPWSMLPPTNLFEAMGAFSHFSFDLSTLINGQNLPIGEVPGTYMSEYLLIKLPDIAVAGLVAAIPFGILALLRADAARRRRQLVFLPLVLALAVPVTFTLAEHPPLYNGIRHFLFVIPPATIAAALGIAALWQAALRLSPVLALATAATAGSLFAFNAVTFVALHPYEYVGYNQLVGGLKGADGRFEGDYWSATMREAATALRTGIEAHPPAKPYKVAICAEDGQIQPFLGPDLELTESWDDADFLLTARNVGCDNLVPGLTYRTISRLGVPLAMVVDLRARHMPIVEPLPWDDDADPQTPAVSFNGPGSATVARKAP